MVGEMESELMKVKIKFWKLEHDLKIYIGSDTPFLCLAIPAYVCLIIQRTKYSKLAMLWRNTTDKAEEKIQISQCEKKPSKLFHYNF